MKPRQVSSVLIFLVSAFALTLAVAAGGAGASTQRLSDQSYTDPAGDSGPAPDITTVSVSNTEDGTTTFKIGIGNYTSSFPQFPTALMSWVTVHLDLDKNAATGDLGSEAQILLDEHATVTFERWNGTELAEVSQPQLTASFANGTVTFTIARSELLDTKGFAFSVFSAFVPGSGGIVSWDTAPDGLPDWTYDLVLPAPPAPTPSAYKPVIGAPVTTPKIALAGKRFTVAFPVTRSDTSEPLMTGKMVCDPSVAGKVITHAESFKGGTAKLSFTVPKTAKGKLVKVKVTIKAGSGAATKVATFKVK